MSYLISKNALKESLIYCKELGRKSYEAVLKVIDNEPTVDEKEIRDKAIERYQDLLLEHQRRYGGLDGTDMEEIAEQMKEVGK